MINVYHIAGVDDRERGFNRQAQVILQGAVYQARLRYEALQLEGESNESEGGALQRLIQRLHARGYTQLRTQQIFQGDHYLGNQELWVDYPDPQLPKTESISWLTRLRQFLGVGKSKE